MSVIVFHKGRNSITLFLDAVVAFVIDDNHVRDHSRYVEHFYVYGAQPIAFSYNENGTGTHNYDSSTGQFVLASPTNTGKYDFVEHTGLLIPDTRKYVDATRGESDVLAKIRIVEIMQSGSLSANIASLYLHIKSSVFKQITALQEEVYTGLYLYEDNGNVPSYSEDDYIDLFPNYLTGNDVNDVSDPNEVRVNGRKNFIVQQIALPTVLNKSFSFELQMNSEGVLHEAQIVTSPRMEAGNAS